MTVVELVTEELIILCVAHNDTMRCADPITIPQGVGAEERP